MEAKFIILAVLALMISALGLMVYEKDRKSPYHIAFASFALSLALWTITIILWYATRDQRLATLWMHSAYAVALFIGASLFYFAYSFPEKRTLTRTGNLLFFTPIIVHALAYFIIPQVMVRDIVVVDGVRVVIQNPVMFWVFTLHFVFFYACGIGMLVRKLVRAHGILRVQLGYIVGGVTITGALGTYFNLILPSPYVERWDLIWLGPIFSFCTLVSIGYAIIRHHVLDVKVIATEIFVAAMAILLAAHMFFSVSFADWVLRMAVFLAVVGIGIFLVRSVEHEVAQRERLELLAKELEGANAELARLDQAKSEFLSIASHQLRTPLTAIKGYNSMLLEGAFGPLAAKVRTGVEKVQLSTDRMVALVNDLLDTSRLESGRMKFSFELIDPGEMIKSVCDELLPKAAERGVTLTCEPPAGLPRATADAMKLRQVAVNLIDNAIKYSDEQTGKATVTLEQQGDELIFRVHDNGWGMTKEEMGFLFKKFSRGRGDMSMIKGTGLGLYVCRRLIEAHHGRIWAESDGKGKGSTFSFALKLGWQPTPDEIYEPKDE